MLEIKKLSVSLDGKELLHNINMTVARGARQLLAGHNGSGKSTLAQVIAATRCTMWMRAKLFLMGAI